MGVDLKMQSNDGWWVKTVDLNGTGVGYWVIGVFNQADNVINPTQPKICGCVGWVKVKIS